MDLSQFSPDELRKMGLEAVIKLAFEGETYPVTNLVKDKYGNSIEQTNKTYQSYDGNLVGQQEVRWTYHDAKVGNVYLITVDDGIGKKQRTVSEYSLNPMEQPVVSRFIVAEPIPLPEKILEGMGGGVTGAASGTKNLLVKIKDTIVRLFGI